MPSAATPQEPPARTPALTLVRGDTASARRTHSVRIEAAALPDRDLERLPSWGVMGTGPARTVADCLRHLPTPDAVSIADAAARAGVARAEVIDVLRRQDGWPYVERGRASLLLVDPRRESWLESVAAVDLLRRGGLLPQSQAVVRDSGGRFVARVDFWWPEIGLVGEVDGWEKYRRRGLISVDDAEKALRDEKQREDRLRDTGLSFVRGSSDEVLAGVFAQRWFAARDRGDLRHVRAQITPAPWPTTWPESRPAL